MSSSTARRVRYRSRAYAAAAAALRRPDASGDLDALLHGPATGAS